MGRSCGDLVAILGVLEASWGSWALQCHVGFIFPEKSPGVLFFYSHRRPGGILKRIHYFPADPPDPPETQPAGPEPTLGSPRRGPGLR